LAVLLYLSAATQRAELVASIEGDGQRIFVAVIDVKRAVIAVVPAAYRPDPTRIPELWLIPPGGKPLPLGVLPTDRPTRIAIPATFADQARRDAGLAVSLEPPGGSPTGQPTGPVIGSGNLTNPLVLSRIRTSRRSVAGNVPTGTRKQNGANHEALFSNPPGGRCRLRRHCNSRRASPVGRRRDDHDGRRRANVSVQEHRAERGELK